MIYILYWLPFVAALAWTAYRLSSGSQITTTSMLLFGTLMFGVIRTVQRRIGGQ